MKFLRKYYSQLLFLIIGILAGFFITRLPIQFEEKISWIALANFLLTILLAIYLEFIVRPSFSNNRNEKDILIDQLKEIRQKAAGVEDSYLKTRNQNPLPYVAKTEIVSNLRTLSNLIDVLKQTDEYCDITLKTEISDKVFACYLKYKKALTGYQFNSASFYYDRLYWNKSHSAFKEIMRTIMHSMIDINKA